MLLLSCVVTGSHSLKSGLSALPCLHCSDGRDAQAAVQAGGFKVDGRCYNVYKMPPPSDYIWNTRQRRCLVGSVGWGPMDGSASVPAP